MPHTRPRSAQWLTMMVALVGGSCGHTLSEAERSEMPEVRHLIARQHDYDTAARKALEAARHAERERQAWLAEHPPEPYTASPPAYRSPERSSERSPERSPESSSILDTAAAIVVKGLTCAYDVWADDLCRVVTMRLLGPRGSSMGCSAAIQLIESGDIDPIDVSLAGLIDLMSDSAKAVASSLSIYKTGRFLVCMALP